MFVWNRGLYYPCYPGGLTKAFTMSYDDGVVTDIEAVAIMRRHGVKATFNLNSGMFAQEPQPKNENSQNKLTLEECLELYGDDMEIAIHGSCHPYWNKLPTAHAMADILDDRRALEKATGKLIRGGAYPFGTWNEDVVKLLDLAGIEYCRTTKSTKSFRLNVENWNTYHPTCHHREPELMTLAEKFTEKPNKTANLWLFYVWGHTYEFRDNDNWYILEDLLKKVAGLDDVWYATNIEIVTYLKAMEKLVWSADRTRVMNPTATELWLRSPGLGEVVKVAPGETLALDN